MAHFPVLFEDFQELDFEQSWSNSSNLLSEEENNLFPDMNIDSNPLLSSASLDYENIANMDIIFEDSIMPVHNTFQEEIDTIPTAIKEEMEAEIPPQVEKEPENKAKIEDHCYSQPKKEVSSKRKRKPVKRFDDSDSESDSDDEVKPKKSKLSSSNKKTKLYEMEPFSDPEMEKCRQNAINAKINRDRKKNEKSNLQSEIKTLKKENLDLKKKNLKYKTRLSSFEARLQVLESILRSNPDLVKAAGNEVESILGNGTSDSDLDSDHGTIYYY